jgi:hypothetical protein
MVFGEFIGWGTYRSGDFSLSLSLQKDLFGMNNHGIYYSTHLWNYLYTIYWMGGMSFIPLQPPSIQLSNQYGIGGLSFS